MELKKLIAVKMKRLSKLLSTVKELEEEFGVKLQQSSTGLADAPKALKKTKRKAQPKKTVPYKRTDYAIIRDFVRNLMEKNEQEHYNSKTIGKILRKEGYRKINTPRANSILKTLFNEGCLYRVKHGTYRFRVRYLRSSKNHVKKVIG